MAGADIVELDIRVAADRQFVLFHDVELGCRTDGTGRVSQHSVAELQRLDVGYGYTAKVEAKLSTPWGKAASA